MENAIEYLRKHQQRHLDELIEICKIPSISTKPQHAGDVRKSVEWTLARCRAAGLKAELHETGGHPLVYAEWCNAGPDAPTYLAYGHVDVQPEGDLSLWDAGPFEPVQKDGWLICRGSADDKGQVLLYVRAAEAWLQTAGKLPINLKLLIEAEEEIGSPNLEPFIRQHTDLLACDAVLISDTGLARDGQPAITRGTRGMVYKEIFLSGPKHDLHSGQFGGAIQNPANALAAMITALHDKDNRVTVPRFYAKVIDPTEDDRAQIRTIGIDDEQFAAGLGVPELWQGETGYTPQERRSIRPALDVNGITSGFQGDGANTIIPARASVKLSMRLVPDQDAATISKAFDEHIRRLCPPGVRMKLVTHGSEANAYITPADNPALQAAVRGLREAFDQEPVQLREGGSLPILPMFKEVLGADCVLLGFASPNCNAHGPNEKVRLPDLDRGAEAIARMMGYLGS